MAPALFKSRRSPAPVEETARVAQAVSAYYEAGRRPATTPLVTRDDVADVDPPVDEQNAVIDTHEPSGLDEEIVTASGQTLEELADELEALIDSIRYGTDPA
jgi:hypothetical protein